MGATKKKWGPPKIQESNEFQHRNRTFHLQEQVTHTHIRNSPTAEATQVSINRLMDEQKAIYFYNGILLSIKREGRSDTSYNKDEPEDTMQSEISQSQKTNTV